jgi:hypothetical protein
MDERETEKCDQCQAESEVIDTKPLRDHRGEGLIAIIDCPKCGVREQLLVQPGDASSYSN